MTVKPSDSPNYKVLHGWFVLKFSERLAISSGPTFITEADFKEKVEIMECALFLMASPNASVKLKHGASKIDVSGEKKYADQDAARKHCKTSENWLMIMI